MIWGYHHFGKHPYIVFIGYFHFVTSPVIPRWTRPVRRHRHEVRFPAILESYLFQVETRNHLGNILFCPALWNESDSEKKYRKAFVNQQFWYWEYDEFLDGLGFECNLDLRVNWKLSLPTGSTAWGISKGASDTSLHIQAQDLLFKTIGYIFEITVGGFTYSNNKHVCSRFLPPHIWDVPPSDPWDPKMVVNLFQRYVTIQRSNGQR